MKRFEHGELFGDDQRSMVGEHHAARANVHGRGICREMCDQHGWRGAGEKGRVVMLGHPEPDISKGFGALCKPGGICQCLSAGFGNIQHSKIKYRQWHANVRSHLSIIDQY